MSSNGRFLKENRNTEESAGGAPVAAQRRRADRVKRKRRRKQQKMILAGALAVVLAVVGIFAAMLNRSNPLEGKWYMDAVTIYEFGKNGRGTMILPASEYAFTYRVDKDVLQIDFEHEGAKDAQYVFELEGNMLTMIGGNSTTQGSYVLTKAED